MNSFPLVTFFNLLLLSSSSLILAQQPYIRKATTACSSTDRSTSVLGYACNGVKNTCRTYLIFRSQPPYDSVSSISSLLSSNQTQLSRINSVSVNHTFETNKMVIVPVRCSCSGEFYQANTSYVVKGGDTPYLITNTFQGLSTCKALRDQNKFLTQNIYTGSKMNVPLRCACPTKNQTDVGIKYLLSYVVAPGNNVAVISAIFSVDTGRTLEANELSEQDSTIYPFTTLLVPLPNPPSSNQTTTPPSSHPSPSPTLQNRPSASGSSTTKWVYLVIGILIGGASVLVVGTIIFCLFFKTMRRNKSVMESKSFEAFEKPDQKMVDGDFCDFLESLSSIGKSLKVYNFEELRSSTQNFSPECLIKTSVYRGIINGDMAAIKKMNGDVLKEINILNKIYHFNLIRLSGVCFSDGNWYLVYEYAVNGPLSDWIYYYNRSDREKILNWTQRMQIALDVATGINYLHGYTSPPHVHKDIKSSNILLDSNFRAKITNFAQARSAEGEEGHFALTRHIVGTKGCMAPEYLEHGLVSPKLDVYAFGVLMMEIVSGKEVSLLYGEENENAPLSVVLGAVIKEQVDKESLQKLMDPSLESNYPLELAGLTVTLAMKCLRKDPSLRPGMDEIVQFLSMVLSTSSAWELSNNVLGNHSDI